MIALNSNLEGKRIVITGATGILCGAMAEELARHGAKVAILGRREDMIKERLERIESQGGHALGIFCDVLDRKTLEEADEKIRQAWGGCDVLVNGAGGNHPDGITDKESYEPEDLWDSHTKTFFDLKIDAFESVFALNFTGALLASQILGKSLLENKGHIINISSMSAPCPMTKVPAYSAAKAGLDNLTQWMAVYFASAQVRVNAIAPGFFLTGQNRAILTNPDGSWTTRALKILEHTPMNRLGDPQDLLGTLIWLIDEEMSRFVTGTVIPVDGGFMAFSGV